jgi:hypothetical protein
MRRANVWKLSAVLALLVARIAGAQAPLCSAWELVNPGVQASSLRAVAADRSRSAAAADSVTSLATEDGATWSRALVPSANLYRVVWNGRAFAANGTDRALNIPSWPDCSRSLFWSADGRHWEAADTADIEVVAGAPGLFLGVRGNEVYSSAGGAGWEGQPDLPTWGAPAALWDGSRFVILTWKFSPICMVTCNPVPVLSATSGELTEWISGAQPGVASCGWTLIGMAFNGERYVAADGIDLASEDPSSSRFPLHVSDDGLTWRSLPGVIPGAREGVSAVAANEHGFVAVRGATVLSSTDGLSWSSADISPLHLIGVMWTGDEYVAVGDDGAGHAAIARSADGSAWTSEAFPAIPARLLAVAGGQRVQLAVGEAGLTLRRECHPPSVNRRLGRSR